MSTAKIPPALEEALQRFVDQRELAKLDDILEKVYYDKRYEVLICLSAQAPALEGLEQLLLTHLGELTSTTNISPEVHFAMDRFFYMVAGKIDEAMPEDETIRRELEAEGIDIEAEKEKTWKIILARMEVSKQLKKAHQKLEEKKPDLN